MTGKQNEGKKSKNFWSCRKHFAFTSGFILAGFLIEFFTSGNTTISEWPVNVFIIIGYVVLTTIFYHSLKGKTAKWLVSVPSRINAVLFMPWVIILSIALLYPEIIVYKVFGVKGTLLTTLLHINMGFFFPIFIIIQFHFSTLYAKADNHCKSMINGYHQAIN